MIKVVTDPELVRRAVELKLIRPEEAPRYLDPPPPDRRSSGLIHLSDNEVVEPNSPLAARRPYLEPKTAPPRNKPADKPKPAAKPASSRELAAPVTNLSVARSRATRAVRARRWLAGELRDLADYVDVAPAAKPKEKSA